MEGFHGEINWEEVPVHILFHQTNHKYKQYFLQKIQNLDLKAGQAGILFMLEKCGEQSQRELADKLRITPPSVTAAIQKLEKLGYVRRTPDEKDQRILRICITEKGKDCVVEIQKAASEIEEVMFRHMSREEILLLRRLILQMLSNLKEI